MDVQRLRNLTTGKLHTEIAHVYEDIEHITGVPGVMTHQLPNAVRAMMPYLRAQIADARFWDGRFDQTHTGEFDLPPMPDAERQEFLARFGVLPDPLAGKPVISVVVGSGAAPEETE